MKMAMGAEQKWEIMEVWYISENENNEYQRRVKGTLSGLLYD